MTDRGALHLDSSWKGVRKTGGLCLFAAGVLLVVFISIVFISQHTLPVPAMEVLETPTRPALLFLLAAIGELLLLPGALALYHALKEDARGATFIATGLLAVAVPMFLTSRGLIISIAQLSDRYLQATDATMRAGYLASAELALETQNIYATIGLALLCVWTIIVGLAMLKGALGKHIGYVVITAGFLTLFSPVGVIFMDIPIVLPFIGLALTAVWQMIVGVKLYRRG